MTDTINTSFNLKHRLVGAAALIMLAVILLPRVLTETGSGSDPIGGRYARDEMRVEPTVISEISVPASTQFDQAENTVIEVLNSDTTEESAISLDQESSGKNLPLPQAGIDRQADVGTGLNTRAVVKGWIAQVGTFSNRDNISRVVSDLRKDGFYPKLELRESNGTEVTMIWVGPYVTREQAKREGSKAMIRTDSAPIITAWPSDD